MRQTPIAIVNPNSNGGQTGKNWDSIEVTLKNIFMMSNLLNISYY